MYYLKKNENESSQIGSQVVTLPNAVECGAPWPWTFEKNCELTIAAAVDADNHHNTTFERPLLLSFPLLQPLLILMLC